MCISFRLCESLVTVRRAAVTTTATVSGQRAFAARIVRSIAHVAAPIARFVALEVIEPLCPTFRHRPMISMARIETVINVSIKTMSPVEPWPRADKQSPDKPIRAVVTVGSAIIRLIVKVSVRTDWSRATHFDCNLSR